MARTKLAKFKYDFLELAKRYLDDVRCIWIYLDSIQIRMEHPLSDLKMDRLRRLNEGDVDQYPSSYPDKLFPHRLKLHQPSRLALQSLLQQGFAHAVNEVDIAVDFDFAKPELHADFADFIDRHKTIRWHGKRKVGSFGATSYSAPRQTSRNTGFYADKPSRITGRLTAHWELKLKGTWRMASSKIGQISDLLTSDLVTIFFRNVRLSYIFWPYVRASLRRLAKSDLKNDGISDLDLTFRNQYAISRRRRSIVRLLKHDPLYKRYSKLEQASVQALIDTHRPEFVGAVQHLKLDDFVVRVEIEYAPWWRIKKTID